MGTSSSRGRHVQSKAGGAGGAGGGLRGSQVGAPAPGTLDLYATWYGVQTDGPATGGVVDIDMWERNAQDIVKFMTITQNKGILPWTGIFIHVEPPSPGNSYQGKPPNAYVYVERIARFIDKIPTQFRVGVQAVIESDSVWNLPETSEQVTAPKWIPFYGNDAFWNKYNGYVVTPSATPLNTRAGYDAYCPETYTGVGPGQTAKYPAPAQCIKTSKLPSNLLKCPTTPPGPSAQPIKCPGGSTDCWCTDAGGSTVIGPGIDWALGSSSQQMGSGFGSFKHPDSAQWYGGSGANLAGGGVPSAVSGTPYQQPTAKSYGFNNACPYKPVQLPDGTVGWPEGCPNNPSHMGWYVALINRILRRMGSKQRISMMNWDKEGNGPIGYQCTAFQFLYGLREFGSADDVHPLGEPWLLFQNGGPDVTVDPDPTQACADWAQFPINQGARKPSIAGGVKTYGDMAKLVAAPEFYWFNGEDMGNGPPQTPSVPASGTGSGLIPATGRGGMLETLVQAGFLGCPQSASDKVGFDGNCGCRSTPYEYATLTSDPAKTITGDDMLGPVYQRYTRDSPGIMPTFSIEHLGTTDDMLNFGLCINSQNFASYMATPDGIGSGGTKYDTLCAANSKCAPRCGVANFFGNWTLTQFSDFLKLFVQKYGRNIADPATGKVRLCVYDMGFVPAAWMQAAGVPNSDGSQFTGLPMLDTPGTPPPWPTVDELNAQDNGIIDWLTECPVAPGKLGPPLQQYACGTNEGVDASGHGLPPLWTKTTPAKKGDPQPLGNPSPATLQCFDCQTKTKKCSFVASGDVGGLGNDTRYYQTEALCLEAQSKGTCGNTGSGSDFVRPKPLPPPALSKANKKGRKLAGAGMGSKCKGEGCAGPVGPVKSSSTTCTGSNGTSTASASASSGGSSAGLIAAIVLLVLFLIAVIVLAVLYAKKQHKTTAVLKQQLRAYKQPSPKQVEVELGGRGWYY